jgi:plastocyanin
MRVILVAAALLIATGWGASDRVAASPTSGDIVPVAMRHNHFVPHRIVARMGQTVRWTNRDAVTHTVASADLRLSSEGIRGGKSFSYRPRRRGTFAYYCTIHAGQTGVMVVR